jgi:hypothetical protein
MGVGKAVDIAIQAARAVAASHALEIVRGDTIRPTGGGSCFDFRKTSNRGIS